MRHGIPTFFLVLLIISTSLLTALTISAEAFERWPGDDPALFDAYEAYRAQDYQRASDLLGAWLAVQPNERITWYSYACFLALTGEDSLAIKALEASYDAGGFPADFSLTDPDLNSLHAYPEFQAIVKRMKEVEEREAAAEGGYRWMHQDRAAVYKLDLPDSSAVDKSLPVLIYLHGGSGTLFEGRALAKRLTGSGFAVISIEAAYRSRDGIGFSHWPDEHITATTMLDSMLLLERTIDMNSAWYRRVLEDASSVANLDLAHVILCGFSQGSMQTFYTLAHDPEPYFAAAVIGGIIPQNLREVGTFSRFAEKHGKLLILHGSADAVADPDANAELMEANGVRTEKRLFPDMGHEVNEELIDALAQWAEGIVTP